MSKSLLRVHKNAKSSSVNTLSDTVESQCKVTHSKIVVFQTLTCELFGVVKVETLVGSFSREVSHWQSVPSVLAVTSSKADP